MSKWVLVLLIGLFACARTKQVGYTHYVATKEKKPTQVFDIPITVQFYQTEDSLFLVIDLYNHFFLEKENEGKRARINLEFQQRLHSKAPMYSIDTSFVMEMDEVQSLTFPLEKELIDAIYELTLTDIHRNVFVYRENVPAQFKDQFIAPFQVLKEGQVSASSLLTNGADLLNYYSLLDSISIKSYEVNCWELPSVPKLMRYQTIKSDSSFSVKNQIDLESLRDKSGRYFQALDVDGKFVFGWTQCYSNNPKNAIHYFMEGQEQHEVSFLDYQKFWFEIAKGDSFKKDRLQREFEKRLEWCNANFSSYVEGWKTHRGWVYLLLGPPNRIETALGYERWYYDFSPNEDGMLTFAKDPNNLHPNDFVLDWKLNIGYELQKGIQRWLAGAITTSY